MKRFLPLLFLLALLILFSSMSYEQQTLLPWLEKHLAHKPFEQALSALHIPYWDTVVSVEERGYFAFVEFLIRKATHFCTFGLIALALQIALPTFRFKAPAIILAIALIASADEWRQSFTPGRTMSFQDVMLDTAGALCFLMLFYGIKNLRKLLVKKRG